LVVQGNAFNRSRIATVVVVPLTRNLRLADAPGNDAGQVTAYGKSGKTRVVLLPATVWHELMSIRDGAPADAPVFASRTRGVGP
jgi:hypothetical protein